jgi:hypothetical protein
MTAISAGLGARQHAAGLGRPGADHPDLDARLGRDCVQAAIAVTVSAIRLFPMVVSVLPLMRTPQTKRRHLVLATHFIAVTLWVECYRLLPKVPRERRIAFTHGLGCGLLTVCMVATTLGYGWPPTCRRCLRRRSCC